MGLSWWPTSYRILGKSIADRNIEDSNDQSSTDPGLLPMVNPPAAENRSSSLNPALLMPVGTADVHAVVFIDSRVPDIQDLLNGLQPGEQAFIIDSGSDGLDQIAAILNAAHFTNLSAIQIVAHGASGELTLGSTAIDAADLASHAGTLATIGAALTADGDIALYACNTAAGAAGQQFIADLAAYTSADVAAATHLVGSADGGGSWTLDASTGAIEAQTPFTAAALANFEGELAINGQLFISTVGGGGGTVDPVKMALGAADNRVMAVNSDGTGTTTVFHDTGTATYGGGPHAAPVQAARDLVLDPASGLYFTVAQDYTLTGNTRYAILAGKLDGSAPAQFYQNPDTSSLADIGGISIDAATHTLYVSQIADYNNGVQANNGIFSFSYDPVTGALSNKQQVVSLFPLTPGAETGDMAAHVVNGLLYFTEVTYTATTGDFRIWSYNVNTHAVTPITPSGVFTLTYTTTPPIQTSGESLRSLAVNSTTNKIYFLQNDVTAGGTTSTPHLWEVSTTPGSTPVEISVPGGLSTSVQDLAIDSATNTLYLSYGQQQQIKVFSIGADGTTLTATGSIPLGLQPPPGVGNPDNEWGSGNSPYDYPTGIDFVDLPTLALTGTSTHAVQQGAALTLLTGAPAITDPTGGYLTGATVTISNFQAGDLLAAAVSGTSITANYANGVLTLSGLDTIAHYKTVMASITFTDGGNSGVTTRGFDWKVNSGEVNNPTGTNFATTSLNIDVNHPPTVTPDTNAAVAGGIAVTGNVLANDSDSDGNALQVSAFTDGSAGVVGSLFHGTYGDLTLNADGSYSFTAGATAGQQTALANAAAGSHPTEVVTYTASDGHGGTTQSTLTVTIDRAPVAVADTGAAVAGGSNLNDNIVTNDTDKDGDSLLVTSFTVGATAGVFGTAVSGTYGNFTLALSGSYIYTAGATAGQQTALANAPVGSHPTEVINYTISDGRGGTSSSTLTITLDRVPVGVADTDSASVGDAPATGNVLANDTDQDNDTLTVTGFTDGAAGTVGTLFHGTYGDITLNADGTYTYVAGATAGQQNALNLAGGHGTEVVNYTMSDGKGGTGSSTLSIDVTTAPYITSVTATTDSGMTDVKAGGIVAIRVNFSTSVSVSGAPELQLNDGLVAFYVNTVGSQVLFVYIVQPGDNTPDLRVLSLHTDGSNSIRDGFAQDAIVTNAATDLHLNIDTTAPTVTVSADHTTLTIGQPTALVTFTFSEAASLFTINDVTVSGGSFGVLNHVGINGAGQDVYTAIFTPDAGNAVTGSIQVSAGSYSDVAANAGTASNTLSITSDTVAPTVSVAADHNNLLAGDTALVTFTFSEAVADFTLGDIVANGGSVGTLTHVGLDGSGHDVYTVIFTPIADNAEAGSVSLNAGSYTDVSGNPGAAGAPVSFSGDTLAPTVAVTAVPNALQAGQTSTVTFTFSEAVAGFALDASHVAVTGGTLSNLIHVGAVGANDVYTAVFTPDVTNAEVGSVQVIAASYTDTAGNAGAVSNTVNFSGDTKAPSVTVTPPASPVLAGQPLVVTFTFSETVTGFDITDITATGGTLTNFNHSGPNGSGQDVYTVEFVPTSPDAVSGTIDVGAGSYFDTAGNAGTASNTATFTGDIQPPSVTVSADHTALLAGQTALVTFTFSEPIASFALDAAHVTVSGGTLSGLAHTGVVGGQDIYTAVFTPDATNTEAGAVQVVAAGYTDVAGNAGAVSNTVNFSGDTLAPSVTVSADHTALLAGQVALVTFTFSDLNPAFALTDVIVSGGTLGNLVHAAPVGGQDVYTATFTPDTANAAAGSVQVKDHAYTDAAGNQSAASNVVNFNGDTVPPTVTVTADHTTLHAGDTALVTFSFSETVTGFALDDVTVSGGVLGNLAHTGIDGTGHDLYTAIFTPDVTDTLSAHLSVTASSYTDVAGNSGAASSAVNFNGDTRAPAAPSLALHQDSGLSSIDHITNNPLIDYTWSNPGDTLQYRVDAAASFTTTAPSFATDGSQDGQHTVSIQETDAAGNVSAISSLSFTLDTTAPHLAGITASPSSGTVTTGSAVQLTLAFDEAVNVSGGTPALTLNDGSSAVYDAAASDSFKLVFDHLVSSTDQANALAVTGFAANGAVVSDVAGNAADLSTVSAVFDALNINPATPPATDNTAPAFTIGGITRPELHFDTSGHILMDAAASAFAGQYGIEYLYLGLPPGTPYPPVDLH